MAVQHTQGVAQQQSQQQPHLQQQQQQQTNTPSTPPKPSNNNNNTVSNNNSNTSNNNVQTNSNNNSSQTQTVTVQQQQQQQQPQQQQQHQQQLPQQQQQQNNNVIGAASYAATVATPVAAGPASIYNQATALHSSNIYLPQGVPHPGPMYHAMLPAQLPSNVLVNNVTANVNLHGWSQRVPFIPGTAASHYSMQGGEISSDQATPLLQAIPSMPVALAPAGSAGIGAAPGVGMAPTSSGPINNRGSRRGRGRGGGRRGDYNNQRYPPPEGSPAPQQQHNPDQQQQQSMNSQQQHQAHSAAVQQLDTQLIATGAPAQAYAPHPQYAPPMYPYATYHTTYFTPQNHMIHHGQSAAAQQATGAPLYVTSLPFYNTAPMYNCMGGYILPPIMNAAEYQYPPGDDGQGEERSNAVVTTADGAMIPQMWHPQPMYAEEYGMTANEIHGTGSGGTGADDMSHNAPSLGGSSETPSMLSPNYPIYDVQMHEMQQQMGVIQIYDDTQLTAHTVPASMGQMEGEINDCGVSGGTIQMVPATAIIPIPNDAAMPIPHVHAHPQQAMQQPHGMLPNEVMPINERHGLQMLQQQQTTITTTSVMIQSGDVGDNIPVENLSNNGQPNSSHDAANQGEIVMMPNEGSEQNLEVVMQPVEYHKPQQRSQKQQYQQQQYKHSQNQQRMQQQQNQQQQTTATSGEQQQSMSNVVNNNNNNKSGNSSTTIYNNNNKVNNMNANRNITKNVPNSDMQQQQQHVQPQQQIHHKPKQRSPQQQQSYQQRQPHHGSYQQNQQHDQNSGQHQHQQQYQHQHHHQHQQHQQHHHQPYEQRKQPSLYGNQQQSRRKYSTNSNNSESNQNHGFHNNNSGNDPSMQTTTKSMSWTNSAQQHKKSTASVSVTATPMTAAGNKQLSGSYSRTYTNQYHHQQQQQQQQQQSSYHNQQHGGSGNTNNNNNQGSQMRNHGTMKIPTSPTGMITSPATMPTSGNNNNNNNNNTSERKSNQLEQQPTAKLATQNNYNNGNNIASPNASTTITTSTTSTTVTPNQFFVQTQTQTQEQQNSVAGTAAAVVNTVDTQTAMKSSHHQQHTQKFQPSGFKKPMPPPSSATATPSQMAATTSGNVAVSPATAVATASDVSNNAPQQQASSPNQQPVINMAPPTPATNSTPAGTPSWASLFDSKTNNNAPNTNSSASNTNFVNASTNNSTLSLAAVSAGNGMSGQQTNGNTNIKATVVPVLGSTPYAKKSVAKAAPFGDVTPITPQPIVTPGGMSYSAASAQGLPQQTPAINSITKTFKPESVINNRISSAPIDEWSLKLADFLTKYKTDLSPISLRPRGLTNRSNYCYINSILQALLGCSPLFNLIRSIPKQAATLCELKIPTINAMISFTSNFSGMPSGLRLRTNKGPKGGKDDIGTDLQCDAPFEPAEIYKLWNEDRDEHVEGRQEDAEEFLGYVLNKLNDEMLEVFKLIAKPNTENGQHDQSEAEDGDEWQMIRNNRNKGSVTRQTDFGRTPLSDIFRGELRSRLQREGEISTDDIQPFFTLQLNIEKAASVKEALEILAGRDQLEGVTGSKSKQEVVAWQQMTLEKLPVVLILHLKWFDYRSDGCTKILKKVEFPVELKIDTKILASKKYSQKQRAYRLFAVVYHDGKEASKGHYISDVYHTGYGSWLRYDDSIVKPVSEHHVLLPRSPRVPYLLLYRRSDTLPPSPAIGASGNHNATNSLAGGGISSNRDGK